MNKKFYAFSMIEVLIVISIIAILAATASPYYRNHIIASRLSLALPLFQGLNNLAKSYYDDGSLPASLTYSGYTITANTATAFAVKPAVRVIFYGNNSISGIGAKEWAMCLHIDGLEGVTDYVAPTGSSNGSHNRICQLISFNANGIYETYCGSWSTSNTEDIQAKYLPKGCNCASISTRSC